MIIKEIRKSLTEYTPEVSEITLPEAVHADFGGLTGSELLQIVRVALQVQAVEETQTCFSDQGFKGSGYRDLISTAEKLGASPADIDVIRNFKPHLPFFIQSLGPHLSNVITTYFSTKYFKEQNRTSQLDRDIFFSYYRTSTGLGAGLSAFSSLNSNGAVDALTEVMKTALGFPDATSTVMPEHLSIPSLGMMSETSILAAQADIGAGMAMSCGPLLRSSDTDFAEDSISHVNIGDSGMNESSFPNGYKMIRRHLYQIAQHFLPKAEIDSAVRDKSKERDIYKKLRDKGLSLKFASHIFDNKIGISAPEEISQSFRDPLYDYLWMEKEIGMLEIFRFDSLDFTQMLQSTAKMMAAARKGPVMSHIQVVRTGGHSLSNYYGLGKISENAKASPISSLTLEEARYHNNNDSVLNALKALKEYGILTDKTASDYIDDAHRSVIERFINLIPLADSSTPRKSVINRWPYTEEKAQENWTNLVSNRTIRDELWRSSHFERVSKTPGLRFKIDDGVTLPEEMTEVTPIQAENFSLADINMLKNSFRAVGEDILDIRPSLIEEVINNPGYGTGGINKATAGLQALSHLKNPETGRYHILDIGIDEAALYALAVALSRSSTAKSFVMCEMQFNDYDFGLFGPEEISSIYQRSNGLEKLPIVIRQSYGFVRGRTIKGIFEKGGAAGIYHSACHVGSIANRYKGLAIVIPNTARAIQMAYRNAAASETPTVILMSNPAMRSIAIGQFPYSGPYLPLNTKLDPMGTYYTYAVKNEPVGSHHHIILTYGEYAPICHYVAEKLYESGIKTLIIDYNYIVPRNENVIPELMSQYSESSIRPKFTVVSQEGDFGFGDVILHDLMRHGISAEKICKKERINQWLAEGLTFPTPERIYNHIVEQHKDEIIETREMTIEDVPFEMQPMAQYFAGF